MEAAKNLLRMKRLSLRVSRFEILSARASRPLIVSTTPDMKANCGKFGNLSFSPTHIVCSVCRAVLAGQPALRASRTQPTKVALRARLVMRTPSVDSNLSVPPWCPPCPAGDRSTRVKQAGRAARIFMGILDPHQVARVFAGSSGMPENAVLEYTGVLVKTQELAAGKGYPFGLSRARTHRASVNGNLT